MMPIGRLSLRSNTMQFKNKISTLCIHNNYQAWWKNGAYHRLDGPAVIHPNGYQFWCKNGEVFICYNGLKEWYKNDNVNGNFRQ